jgi:hypothetical protein
MAPKPSNGNRPSPITGIAQGGSPMTSVKLKKKKKTSRGK